MECACLTLHCARGPASHGAAARSRACCARQPNTGTYIHGAARLAKPTARAWCADIGGRTASSHTTCIPRGDKMCHAMQTHAVGLPYGM